MALPLAPIVWTVARYGAVAAATYAVTRRIEVLPVQQDHEDILDQVEDGVSMGRAPDRQQMNAAGRWRRVVRFGETGPGVEIDATILGRFRIRTIRK